MASLLSEDTPMLMIYLQRVRTKSKSVPIQRAIREAEHRCKYYERLLKHARAGEYRKLSLVVEAIDIIREQERERDAAIQQEAL